MKETDIAWAAGLFEGEGCFSSHKRKKDGKTNVITCLSMIDRDVVYRFFGVVVVGNVRLHVPKKENHRLVYVWNAGGYANMRHVFGMFAPYLEARRTARASEILAGQPAPYVRRNVPPPCGLTTKDSGSGAVRHERKGELPCEDCARERAAYTRLARRRDKKDR